MFTVTARSLTDLATKNDDDETGMNMSAHVIIQVDIQVELYKLATLVFPDNFKRFIQITIYGNCRRYKSLGHTQPVHSDKLP